MHQRLKFHAKPSLFLNLLIPKFYHTCLRKRPLNPKAVKRSQIDEKMMGKDEQKVRGRGFCKDIIQLFKLNSKSCFDFQIIFQ
ncbi:hypothetical protein BI362_11695 [Streptococcus parauberis]|nr:hypothetical protein BI362_11695 [Streptococcus parauberis]